MDNFKSQSYTDTDDLDFSIVDILIVVGRFKRMVLGITSIFIFLAILASLIITPVYSSRAVIMPPQQQQSTAASALNGLSSMVGMGGSAFQIKNQDDMYLSLMNSEGFQRKLIKRFELQERYKTKLIIDTRLAINSRVHLGLDKKSGFINIEVDDTDPVFAANMANAYVEELGHYLGKFVITEAQQKKHYYENQIKKIQNELSIAEKNYRQFQQRSGLQLPTALADIGIKEIVELHGQIRARELQLQAISLFATHQNSEVKKLMSELAAMRAHLAKIERGASPDEPQQGPLEQEALLAYKNMKIQENLLESVVKQFEYARLDESKEAPLLQVVDEALPAERRTSPKRTQFVLVSGFSGFILSLLLVYIINMLRKTAQHDDGNQKLKSLAEAWKL